MHALSTQASEKSVFFFTFFTLWIWSISCYCINLLAFHLHLASWLYLSCFVAVFWLFLTWPNQPGPCGTLWSSHYNNISHVVRAGRRVISSLLFEVFIPNTGELVTLQYLSLCSFYFYFFGRGVSSLYRTHNTKVKLLVSLYSCS